MKAISKFEKVTFPQFYESMKAEFGSKYAEEKETFMAINHQYESLKLPRRATVGSAGYDFFSPITFVLGPGETIKIPTGIRAIMDNGWFLMCAPRSGLGFKYRLRLENTIGLIDSDYAFSENEGHIFAKITNEGSKRLEIKAGDAFMQGVFIPFGITVNDDAEGLRNGGFGSTDN